MVVSMSLYVMIFIDSHLWWLSKLLCKNLSEKDSPKKLGGAR